MTPQAPPLPPGLGLTREPAMLNGKQRVLDDGVVEPPLVKSRPTSAASMSRVPKPPTEERKSSAESQSHNKPPSRPRSHGSHSVEEQEELWEENESNRHKMQPTYQSATIDVEASFEETPEEGKRSDYFVTNQEVTDEEQQEDDNKNQDRESEEYHREEDYVSEEYQEEEEKERDEMEEAEKEQETGSEPSEKGTERLEFLENSERKTSASGEGVNQWHPTDDPADDGPLSRPEVSSSHEDNTRQGKDSETEEPSEVPESPTFLAPGEDSLPVE